jgi:CheY-like chemotaxis protein
LENAREGAARAATLTERLLAFSRQSPLSPRVLSFNDLVSRMSELLRRSIGERIELETALAGGLWLARVDPSQLESAVLNLAVNARDAMPDGGKLTIETANVLLDERYAAGEIGLVPGQYVMVAVSDVGVGMAPDVLKKVFDPFFTTKPVGKGTGLGLSMVYGFAKQSGGHVRIYSEVGRGTTVKVYLPRHFGSAEEADAPSLDRLPTAASRAETVLVVEDEERVRMMTCEALGELGYTVHEASSGEEALKLFDVLEKVDILFTDIVMGGMTGRQLADALRQRKQNLKVLYTTGYTRNAVIHNGVLDPGVAFLPKPFTIEDLAVKLRSVLDA